MNIIMKNPIRKLIILFELIFSISIFGCAGIWWPAHRDMYENLEEEKIKTIAVLPIRNSKLDSNEINEVNQYFMAGISNILKNYILIGPEESLQKLNRDSLTERYYNNPASYYYTRTISTKLIRDVGASIGCDAIVQGEVIINYTSLADQKNTSTRCIVAYSLVSAKDGEKLWGNLEESQFTTDLTSGESPFIYYIKACINRLFLYTYY